MTGTPDTRSRTVLPIPERPFTGSVMFDAERYRIAAVLR